MFVTNSGAVFRPLRISEARYEAIVLAVGPHVLHDWDIHRWKKRVYTPEGRGAEPDLVLLSKTSFDWTVVEVELERHSITGHIDDQLDRLSRARYGPELEASFVELGIAPERAKEYLRSRPGFLCIADAGSVRLADCCQAHGFDIALMLPFANELGEPAVEVRGLPGQYRQVPRSADPRFIFFQSGDEMMGRSPLLVPSDFPAVDAFTLRHSGVDIEISVVTLASQRIVFLPENQVSTGNRALHLHPIDIERAVFEIVKGN